MSEDHFNLLLQDDEPLDIDTSITIKEALEKFVSGDMRDQVAMYNVAIDASKQNLNAEQADFFENVRLCTRYAAKLGTACDINYTMITNEANALLEKLK